MNWPVIKLRDLQQKKRGSLDPSKNSDEIFTLYSIPAYDMGEPQILRGNEIGSSKQLVSNGDVLISKIVPHIRRAWVVDDSYGHRQIASGEWIVFNSEKILPVFFRQFLLSDVFHRKFMTTVAGVGGSLLRAQPRLVADFNFSLPPLAEQQRIAAVLDTADRILKQRESAIAKLDQLVQSVFFNMFGDLVNNLNNWQVVKLNDACLIKAQYGAGLSAVEFNASLPRYVRITDINEDGFLNEKVVSPSGSKSDWQDYFLNDGDILFARSGATVGKAYLHSNQIHQCIFAGYLIRFVPNKKLMTSEFLYALTKSEFYKKWVKAKQNAVAQPNINANQYGNELVFPLPPITLQEEFTNFYKKIKSFKEVELLASIKHNQLQSSLQHQSFAVN